MDYIHPMPKGSFTLTQPFGSNPSNGNNPRGGHTGDDYGAPIGTPVYAIADGTVEFEGILSGEYWQNAWWLVPAFAGICAVIDHGDNRPDAVYGHLSSTIVNQGDRVTQGQVIGYVGETGLAYGSHLHFEILPPNYILDGPTYGRVDPSRWIGGFKEDQVALATRQVTNDVAFARVAPDANAAVAPEYPDGIAKGSTLAVVGYVQGQDPYNTGDDAWYKTPRGYYVWANAAGNDISGLAMV